MKFVGQRMPYIGQRMIAIALVLIGVVGLAGCDSLFNTDAQEYVSRGIDYYRSGDVEAGIIEFRNALQENADHAGARYFLGVARLSKGEYALARRDLERASALGYSREKTVLPLTQARLAVGAHKAVLEAEPMDSLGQADLAHFHSLRGRAALAMGNIERTKQEFDVALSADPGSARARFGQVLLAEVEENQPRMREWIQRTLSIDEKHVEAWRKLASLELAEGQESEAEAALDNAIASSGTPMPQDLYRRAILQLRRSNLEGTREDAEHLVRLAPEFAGSHYVLGLVELREGNIGEAQGRMESALSDNDRFAPAHLLLGVIHGDAGRYDQARYRIERYQVYAPDAPIGSLMLALLEAHAGNMQEAREHLNAHIQQYPYDSEAMALRASLNEGRTVTPDMTKAVFSVLSGDAAASPAALGLTEMGDGEYTLSSSSAPRDDEMAPVRQALIDGDFAKALSRTEALLKRYPDAAQLYNLKGAAHFGQGDLGNGAEALQRAVGTDPGNAAAVRNLGQILRRAGREEAALRLFRQAHKANPDDLSLTLDLSRLEYGTANREDANRLLREAMDNHPDAREIRLLYARRLVQGGEAQAALELMQPLEETLGGHPALLIVQAEAHEQLGAYSKALTAWEALVEQQPDNTRARLLLARSQAQVDDFSQAREQFRHVADARPESLEPRLLVMRTYLMEADYESAASEYEALTDAFEMSRPLLEEGARLALALGEERLAIQRLRQAQQTDPTEQGAIDLAQAHQRASQLDSARAVLEGWHQQEQDGTSRRGKHLLANLRMTTGDNEAAATLYEELLAGNPDDPIVLNNLGWLLRESAPQRAVTLAERASERVPDSVDIQHTLAIALKNTGDAERAVTTLETAVGRDPRPDLRLELARLYIETDQEEQAAGILQELAEVDDFAGAEQARELLEELEGTPG